MIVGITGILTVFFYLLTGVPHSGEIPYVFGWPQLQLAPEVRRDSRIPIDVVPWNEVDYEYADFTMDLFTNFAKFQ